MVRSNKVVDAIKLVAVIKVVVNGARWLQFTAGQVVAVVKVVAAREEEAPVF